VAIITHRPDVGPVGMAFWVRGCLVLMTMRLAKLMIILAVMMAIPAGLLILAVVILSAIF